jgi:hypothetical protein
METIQIEITNACVNSCSNCTRFCGHHPKPFFMTVDQFRAAVDSLVDFPNMVGVMGGEPLLHPQFEEFCRYLQARIPPNRCGLWTCLPKGREHHARLITDTFWNILLNDHTYPGGIPHMPLLLTPREMTDPQNAWYAIDHCGYQNCWSASITPKGAYFCEVAAALDTILNANAGWPVEPGWWKRSPYHFISQMEAFCLRCGGALRGPARMDIEGVDDISPWWLETLKQYGSPKVRAGRYRLFEGKAFVTHSGINDFRQGSRDYFHRIAAKYDLVLLPQPNGHLRPVMRA